MSLQELDDMKKRLKEMEDEAAALIEMQAKVEKEMGSAQGLFLLRGFCNICVSKHSVLGFSFVEISCLLMYICVYLGFVSVYTHKKVCIPDWCVKNNS